MDTSKKYNGKAIWRIMLVVMLYSALAHWKDIKAGFLDGMHDAETVAATSK